MDWSYNKLVNAYKKIISNDDIGVLSAMIFEGKDGFPTIVYENSLSEYTNWFDNLEDAKKWCDKFASRG